MRPPARPPGRFQGNRLNRSLLRPVLAASLLVLSTLAFAAPPAASRDLADAVDCEALVQSAYRDLRHEGQAGTFPPPHYRDVPPHRAERTARQVSHLREQRGRDFPDGELQAEVDRLARDTKAPAALGKLFAALGNDPRRIAE